ncbi:MAG: hypothetical protein R3C14_20450 [Caldilineaceae bacterium]
MTLIEQNQAPNGRVALRSIGSGVIFLALFGVLWAEVGIGGLQGLGAPWFSVVALALGLLLLVGGIALLLASRRLPAPTTPAAIQERRRRRQWFPIIFAAEFILIAIAGLVCRALNRLDLFLPLIMLIVGLHFFPLAALFHVKNYYVVGALLCLVAILTLLVVPEMFRLSEHQIVLWQVVLGFCGAIILWGVGFLNWRRGQAILAHKDRWAHQIGQNLQE